MMHLARAWMVLLAIGCGTLLLSYDLNGEVLAAEPQVAKPAYDLVESYKPLRVEGWSVLVHQQLFEPQNSILRDRMLKLLGDHLFRISVVVPSSALAKLRQVSIWVELAHPKHPCMCYHPGAEWLLRNGMNPAKAKCVELSNCENFLTWTEKQPWMVLHELAHAYHDQFLSGGFENPQVLAAFEGAKQEKLYESILRNNGSKEKAYALTNQQEYFAEQSEALFGANDFYPFVSAELREYDPRAYKVLTEMWGIK